MAPLNILIFLVGVFGATLFRFHGAAGLAIAIAAPFVCLTSFSLKQGYPLFWRWRCDCGCNEYRYGGIYVEVFRIVTDLVHRVFACIFDVAGMWFTGRSPTMSEQQVADMLEQQIRDHEHDDSLALLVQMDPNYIPNLRDQLASLRRRLQVSWIERWRVPVLSQIARRRRVARMIRRQDAMTALREVVLAQQHDSILRDVAHHRYRLRARPAGGPIHLPQAEWEYSRFGNVKPEKDRCESRFEGVRNCSGKVDLKETLHAAEDFGDYSASSELTSLLEQVRSLCLANPELALTDAALTFLATVYNSNGTWLATGIAAKQLLKDVAMCMPAQKYIQETLARVDTHRLSPQSDIFAGLEAESLPLSPIDIAPEEAERYVRLEVAWGAPGSAMRQYYDQELTVTQFAAIMKDRAALERKFHMVYGFSADGLRPYEFARRCTEYKDLAGFIKPDDTIAQHWNVATMEGFMLGLQRAKSMGHLIIGNAIVVALGGILGVGFLKTHAPMLADIAFNLMGPGRDFAKLVRAIGSFIKDSAVYFAYVYSGDSGLLKHVEDALTAALVVQDRLEGLLRDRKGDQMKLVESIEKHASDTSIRHGRARMAATPGEANPWGQLLLRALQLRDDARRRTHGNFKMQTFLVMTRGPVGCGKTVAMKEWAERIVSAVRGESAPDDGSFADVFIQSDPKFYDGIVVGQHVIGYDDAWGHVRQAPPGDPSVKIFLEMCSEQVVMAPMSDVKDKGQIPLSPDFVFVAENNMAEAIGRFTNIVSAVYRRANVHLLFKYRDGLVAGQTVDYKKDVIVELQQYMVPRTNDFSLGELVTISEGSIDEIMQQVMNLAETYGVEKRAELAARSMVGVCRTCRRPGCLLGPGVPRALHFDAKLQSALDDSKMPRLDEPQEGELVVVSGFVAIPIVYTLYWFVRSCRMVWWTNQFDDDTPRPLGRWLAAMAVVPFLWTFGWLALTAALPVHAAVSFWAADDPDWWLPYVKFRNHVVRVAMAGDLLVRQYAPWIRTRYVMARIALGYSVGVEDAITAFKSTTKYKIMLRLIVLLGFIAAAATVHVIAAPSAVPARVVAPDRAMSWPEVSEPQLHLAAGVQYDRMSYADVLRVTRRFVIHRGAASSTAVVLPIGHNVGLTVAHLFPATGDYRVSQSALKSHSIISATPYHLPRSAVTHVTSDFAVVQDMHIVLYDRQLVLKSLSYQTRQALMIVFEQDQTVRVEGVIAVYAGPSMRGADKLVHPVGHCYRVLGPCKEGSCGSPLLVWDLDSSSWQIFATLVATDFKTCSYFQAVTPELEAACVSLRDRLPDGPSLQSLRNVSGRLPVSVVEAPLHEKSALLWADASSVHYVGRTKPELSSVPKCGMVHTSFHDVVEAEFGVKDTFVKPEWRPKLWPGKDFPYGMMTQHVEELNSSYDGVAQYPEEVGIVRQHFREVFADTALGRPLTTRESLNGIPGRIKGINRSTSVGGWNRFGAKSKILVPDACPHYPNGITLPVEFEERVQAIEAEWAAGHSVSPTCRIIPKMNEVREKPVARQINVVELEWIVAARKLLEPIHEAMRNNKRYGSMIGKSPIGSVWRDVHTRAKKVNSEKFTDADGVKFDKKHGGTIRGEAREAYMYVGAKLGYSKVQQRMVGQIVEDMFQSWQCFMGEVFIALFGIISGVPGTSDMQTFIGWFIVRVCLVVLYGVMVLKEENFYSIHGGDDLLMALAEPIGYSGEQFALTMRKLGYEYTSDTDKTKPPEPCDPAQASFYKRKFLESEGRMLAPLSQKSVRKMLMWRDADVAIGPREQEAEILRTALGECALLGRDGYVTAAERIARIGSSAGYVVAVPDFDEQMARFDKNELRTWTYEPDLALGPICDCHMVLSNISGTVDLGAQERATAPQELDAIDGGEEQKVEAPSYKLAMPILREVTEALRRPVLIGEVPWTAGLSTFVYPLNVMKADPIYGRNMNNFYAHRGVLVVKLSVVLPAMSCGALVASLYANNNVDLFTTQHMYKPAQIMTHDSNVLIDVAVGNAAVLRKRLPRWADATFTNSTDNFIGFRTLRLALAELIPVASSVGTTVAPTIFIWAWMEDAEQMSPTPLTAISGSLDVGEFGAKFAAPVMRFMRIGASSFGAILRAGHAVSGALIAAGFGFVAQLPVVPWVRTRLMPFLATGEGVDAVVRLDLSAKSLTVHNQEILQGTEVDHFDFGYLLSKPSLFGTFAWDLTMTAHTKIATIPIHPAVGGALGTPLAWLSSMFNMWTGSLKVTLYFSVPSTVRGSLIVVYTPNQTTAPTYGVITQCEPVIIDVAGSTSVEFDIGWAQSTPALDVGPGLFPTITSAVGSSPQANGYLSIFVQQPLIASGASAFSTAVVVTAVPGEDFAFFDPTLDGVWGLSLVSGKVDLPLFQTETRHFQHRVAGVRRSPEQIASITGGSIITNLRQLIKRKCPHFISRIAAEASTGNALDMVPFVCGNSTDETGANIITLNTFLTNAALPFAGYAGSVRHTVTLLGAALVATTGSAQASFTASRISVGDGSGILGRYCTTTNSFQLFNFSRFGEGAEMSIAGGVGNQVVAVELPYIDTSHMRPVPIDQEAGDATVRYVVTGVGFPNAAACVFHGFLNAGDDFNVAEWIGVPPQTVVSVNYGSWGANP